MALPFLVNVYTKTWEGEKKDKRWRWSSKKGLYTNERLRHKRCRKPSILHLHAHRRSQLETCASIAAARSPSQPWKANMFTVTSPFSLVLWISKKSLSFHVLFVQSRYHNYFHTFQYTWHLFILGWCSLGGFQLKNIGIWGYSGDLLFKILLQRPTALGLCAGALFCHCAKSGHVAAKWDFCSCLVLASDKMLTLFSFGFSS